MAREPEYDLPDGIVKLPPEPGRPPGGCGFTGCMWTLMIVSGILLAIMIAIAVLRPWPTPVILPGR